MNADGLIKAIVILIAVGIVAWAADRWLPLEQPIKGIVMFLIALLGVLVLLAAVGVVHL